MRVKRYQELQAAQAWGQVPMQQKIEFQQRFAEQYPAQRAQTAVTDLSNPELRRAAGMDDAEQPADGKPRDVQADAHFEARDALEDLS